MRTVYNRFALIPFHCTDCHRYIWLEKYRKAEVFTDIANPPFYKKRRFARIVCHSIYQKLKESRLWEI